MSANLETLPPAVLGAAGDGGQAEVAATPYRGRRAVTHIPSLDGIRAVSFLIVFVAHSGMESLFPFPGGFGVTVFFFLSGFLITTLIRAEHETTGTVNIRHFYLRRVLRILPPFYLVLGAATCLTALGWGTNEPLSARVVTAQALHVSNYWFVWHGYAGAPAGTIPYWSLAVEEHFYLVFPVLYLLLSRSQSRRTQAGIFWLLCGVVLLWRCVLVLKLGAPDDRTYMGTDTRFDSILFGCAIAVAMNPVLDHVRGRDRWWKWILFPSAIALLLFTFTYRAPWFRETVRYSLQGIALTPIFVAAIRFPDWGPFRILNTKPVAFLGVLSYTLYLVHDAVLIGVYYQLPLLSPTGKAALAFAIALAVALLMHRFVEQPCARLRKRLAGPAAFR